MAGEYKFTRKFGVLDIEVDIEHMLAYAAEHLDQFKAKAPLAVRNAINNTAKKAKKLDEKVAKATYTDSAQLNSLGFSKATVSNLEAILRDKGENISMMHFKYRAGKNRISVLINKKHGGYKNLIGNDDHRGPFIVDGKQRKLLNGGTGMMVRVPGEYYTDHIEKRRSRNHTKHTEALKKLYSISPPVQRGNPDVWDIEVMPVTIDTIYKELDEEITRILTRMLKG